MVINGGGGKRKNPEPQPKRNPKEKKEHSMKKIELSAKTVQARTIKIHYQR
ncbi:hypothetical protein [Streptomyces sp. NPDC029003]|uniref:hypothetical protein n=1 Tax=Streptomyces sp. NPDC029003 TaxID=3155125 RepID=UPI0033E0F972